MNELSLLIKQRAEVFEKIREIEETCEGIKNENNAKKTEELNLKKTELLVEKKEMSQKLNNLNSELSSINSKLTILSEVGIERILNAIKNQRWFFFKNKPKVLMDKLSGLLWANLDYFPYKKNENRDSYDISELDSVINNYDFDGIKGFRVPTPRELWNMIRDKSFIFKSGNNWRIKDNYYWAVNYNGNYRGKDLDHEGETNYINSSLQAVIPCSSKLINNSNYESDICNSNIYTEKERLQFTLDLFVNNELIPIFKDYDITQLYIKIYFEKPKLLEKLKELEGQIKKLQNITLLSSEFDYTVLLSKYNVKEIDSSIIKYYKGIQNWTNELLEKINYYENQKEDIIEECNNLRINAFKKNIKNLSNEESEIINKPKKYFEKYCFADMNSTKMKILLIKDQADELEERIEVINYSEDSIYDLAELEEQKRASFAFIAENSANIIKNSLIKIEYFEKNKELIKKLINICNKWKEDYNIFKTDYKESYKENCKSNDCIEETYLKFYAEWQNLRLIIQDKFNFLIEKELKNHIQIKDENKEMAIEQLISSLLSYRNSIDNFYQEKRIEINKKPSFESEEKFEVKEKIADCIFKLQSQIKNIIFNCINMEDKIFILDWARDLLDIQIDEIVKYVNDKYYEKLSNINIQKILALKKKDYDIFLLNEKSYEEAINRKKHKFNSLIKNIISEINK